MCFFALDTSLTCENGVTTLSCGNGKIIIHSAKYGRTDSTTCSYQRSPSELSNTKCNTCSQSNCSVQASSNIFSDPCDGTYKYLNISYSCICPGIREYTVPDSSTSLNKCDLNISIISANYGRTNSTTCSAGRPANEVANTNCYASSSLSTVITWCQGHKSCVVKASASTFTDPCQGTFKYLNVTYVCVNCKCLYVHPFILDISPTERHEGLCLFLYYTVIKRRLTLYGLCSSSTGYAPTSFTPNILHPDSASDRGKLSILNHKH
uniref:SUEL-type lectin domain-containing protein n=1 Tax=Electrophorus electricus TaxID=8005 RepID=A0A4W4FTH0_ELEEL